MAQKARAGDTSEQQDRVVLPGGRSAGAQRGVSSFAREIVETIILTAIVFLVVRAAAQPFKIDGPSMQPGLHTGEYVLASPILYAFGGGPQRGDVIVLHPPSSPGQTFIKRVIGLPGDKIRITQNAVYINGVKLNEPYINGQGQDYEQGCGLMNTTVASGQYLVLGDNRGNSEDSRCFGSVPRQNIIGKAVLVALPLNNAHWIATYPATFAGVGAAK